LLIEGHRSVRLGSAWLPHPLALGSFLPRSGSMREQLPPLAPTGKPKLPVQVTSLSGDLLTRVPPPPLRRCPVRLLPSSDPLPKQKTVSGSSLGFPQRPPLHRHHRVRPLSVARGPGLPHPELVPSSSFFPTSTAYSAHGFAGLLHPAASHGVRPVSSRWPTLKPTTDPPPRRLFPLRSSSAELAGSCHQVPVLRAVERAAAEASVFLDLEDLFPVRSSTTRRFRRCMSSHGVPSTQAFTWTHRRRRDLRTSEEASCPVRL